jgi:hypothetical protein
LRLGGGRQRNNAGGAHQRELIHFGLIHFSPWKLFMLDYKAIRHWQRCQHQNDSATIFLPTGGNWDTPSIKALFLLK